MFLIGNVEIVLMRYRSAGNRRDLYTRSLGSGHELKIVRSAGNPVRIIQILHEPYQPWKFVFLTTSPSVMVT